MSGTRKHAGVLAWPGAIRFKQNIYLASAADRLIGYPLPEGQIYFAPFFDALRIIG
jgi:hypothetical protein